MSLNNGYVKPNRTNAIPTNILIWLRLGHDSGHERSRCMGSHILVWNTHLAILISQVDGHKILINFLTTAHSRFLSSSQEIQVPSRAKRDLILSILSGRLHQHYYPEKSKCLCFIFSIVHGTIFAKSLQRIPTLFSSRFLTLFSCNGRLQSWMERVLLR